MSRDYPSDWDSRRKRVYRRDDFRCQNCGSQGGRRGDVELHAHHIVPKARGGTHKMSNLKTVCKDCHNAIHGSSMAPTGSSEPIDDSINTDRAITDSVFNKCPICWSQNIGVGSDDMEIHCDDCELKLKRVSSGLRVDEINENLIDSESPLKEASKYTLAEPAWLMLADDEYNKEVDFTNLQRQSRKYQRNMDKFRKSKVPPALLIISYFGVLALLNSFMPITFALVGGFVLLLAIAISLPKVDSHIKKLVFKLSRYE